LSRRLGVAACVIAAAALLHAPGAAADHSVIEWVSHGAPPGEPVGVGYSAHSSPDGSSVVYITGGRLVPQDTDSALDLYEWTDGVNELLSIGPAGGNAEVSVEDEIAASRDLSRVLFITEEGLVPEDTDRARDLYEHAGGATRLLTNGGVPFEGRGLYHSTPRVNYVTPDGSHVFFTTRDPLVPEDTAEDSALIEDVYVRSQGVTRLVTAYPDGGNAIGSFGGATTNGSRAWFNASLPLVPEDQDGYEYDVYERSGGTTTLVSRGISGNTFFAGASADGSRIFIGSFNFDPRSARLNTEMGFVIDSPELAQSIGDTFARSIPGSAYEVRLAADGGLRWVENAGSQQIVHETEPGTTFWKRLVISLISMLPIEWLL